MAIETGDIYKKLYFDGESSGTYGVYITGSAVYNAPQRDVEMVSVPGRNGQLALDKGRYENIDVTYHAGLFGVDEEDFSAAISEFRNYLCSRNGYCRLEDDYNPDEYRMAVYKSGLDVNVATLRGGEFDITFNCKPQRWLKSGEEGIGIFGEAKEPVTGSVVPIDNTDGAAVIESALVEFKPLLIGGNPTPTRPSTIRRVSTFDVYMASATSEDSKVQSVTMGSTACGGTVDLISGEAEVTHVRRVLRGASDEDWTMVRQSTSVQFSLQLPSTVKDTNDIICDHFPTIPNGTVNTTGVWSNNTRKLTINITNTEAIQMMQYIEIGPWKNWLKKNVTSIAVALESPRSYAIKPITNLQSGLKSELYNLSTSILGDTITVTFDNYSAILNNPTLFESKPLLDVGGYGDVKVNGETITIANTATGEVVVGSLWMDPARVDNIETSRLNEGDDIYFKNSPNCRLVVSGATMTGVSVVNQTNCDVTAQVVEDNCFILMRNFALPGFEFGAAKSAQYGVTADVMLSDQTTVSVEWAFDIDYDGVMTIRTHSTVTYSSSTLSTKTIEFGGASLYANATGDRLEQILIDLDLGEAYTYDGDNLVSLNNIVSLPSDLPVLVPGTNIISRDESIDKLNVIPRWWKI